MQWKIFWLFHDQPFLQYNWIDYQQRMLFEEHTYVYNLTNVDKKPKRQRFVLDNVWHGILCVEKIPNNFWMEELQLASLLRDRMIQKVCIEEEQNKNIPTLIITDS